MVEVVLEGPGKNALGSALMVRTLEAVRAADGAPLLLRGAGDAFSAGLDLKEVATLDREGMRAFLGHLATLLDALWRYPAPTVAAVNGHAIAGGCLVALLCDHRVGTSDPRARIGLNEVAIGVRFPPYILRLVQARIGALRTPTVVLGAALHAPPEALRLGILDEVADEPVAVARERLRALAAHPPAVYAATRAALRAAQGPTPEEERIFEEEVLPVWTSGELKARVAAILGKKG